MAKLTAAERKKIPKSKMGLPKKKGPRGGAPKGTYPMEDEAHAINAKSRASQQRKKGNLSAAQKKKIDAKANKIIKAAGGKVGKKKTTKRK